MTFEAAMEGDYLESAFHFIKNNTVVLTWRMVRMMLAKNRDDFIKDCIKNQIKFE